jgi:hypothetical protein
MYTYVNVGLIHMNTDVNVGRMHKHTYVRAEGCIHLSHILFQVLCRA